MLIGACIPTSSFFAMWPISGLWKQPWSRVIFDLSPNLPQRCHVVPRASVVVFLTIWKGSSAVAIDLLKEACAELEQAWRTLAADQRTFLLDRFKVRYSFNSGNIENPEITYHDTAEVFDENGVSNFTGDVRTIYEINNLKNAWKWLEDALVEGVPLDEGLVLDAHRVLTRGTYDDARWAKGERPGTFKKGDYRVADDVGAAPEEVSALVASLLDEVNEAMAAPGAEGNALTIAAYLHADLVDIHPFADGNGRTARLLMNLALMRLGAPPCSISTDDRLAYFGALDAYHDEGDLVPFRRFCEAQLVKTWESLLVREGFAEISAPRKTRFDTMSKAEIKRDRLASRGEM